MRAQNGGSPKEVPKTSFQEAFFEPSFIQPSPHQRASPEASVVAFYQGIVKHEHHASKQHEDSDRAKRRSPPKPSKDPQMQRIYTICINIVNIYIC